MQPPRDNSSGGPQHRYDEMMMPLNSQPPIHNHRPQGDQVNNQAGGIYGDDPAPVYSANAPKKDPTNTPREPRSFAMQEAMSEF